MAIRGFTLIGDSRTMGILVGGGASPRVVNNVIHTAREGINSDQTYALIENNLIYNIQQGISIAHSWGTFRNNIIMHASGTAFWNKANYGQPLFPDYNLFWDFSTLYRQDSFLEWGEHNIVDLEPRFEDSSYRLQPDSPGIDQGDPGLKDRDGSRSDIGVYGGPYAYPPPER